jgi:hypothetical protein
MIPGDGYGVWDLRSLSSLPTRNKYNPELLDFNKLHEGRIDVYADVVSIMWGSPSWNNIILSSSG